jgi:serine/threonine protein kinase
MKDNQELCGGVGTPHYTAPEVLSHTRYGPKVDTFSYGVVLWEMLMRKVPYGDMAHVAIYEHVVTRGWRLPVPNDIPDGLKRLVSRCWSKSPSDRPEFGEIVTLFERGEVSFPGSEVIDIGAIRATRKCPPLDLEYALRAIRNPGDSHFSSICYSLAAKMDGPLKDRLRGENLMKSLSVSEANIDAALIFAGCLLKEDEFGSFLREGGLDMFKACVETSHGPQMSAALRFGLRVPRAELSQLKVYLPQIVAFLKGNLGAIHSHALQFLTLFSRGELDEFRGEISSALLSAVAHVDDQATFDAIVALFPLCRDSLNVNQMRVFYQLLGSNFVVSPAFVSALINSNDQLTYCVLILQILKASAKSDLSEVFLDFLIRCAENEKGVFAQLYKMQDFFPTLQERLESGNVKAPLFLLFCIAPIRDAAMKLANHPVLSSLIQMKGSPIQRLQIFSILTMSEDFCNATTHIDGIINFLVASLSSKPIVGSAVRLVAAFSTHSLGCQILSENGVLELFTQLFLSSSSGEDTAIAHTILRNVANQNCEIPQGSLIVSCLMHDLIYEVTRRCEIMDTLVALVQTMPGSVQEHDLQRIVMPQLSREDPLLIRLSLKLFASCDPVLLRNLYPHLLGTIHGILDNPQFMFPEIIEACLEVVVITAQQFDIAEFIKKTELLRFINDAIALLGASDEYSQAFRGFTESLEGSCSKLA